MRYCPECKVSVGEPAVYCPLCGAKLDDQTEGKTAEKLYPDFSKPDHKKMGLPFAAKLLAFISLAAVIICTVLDLIISGRLTWSVYVAAGILVAWVTIALPILRQLNLNTMLLYDLCSISALLILIDATTGWNRWSVTYVLPCFYIAIATATVILALVFRKYWREYILSLLAVSAIGIFPLLCLIFRLPTVPYFCAAAVLFALVLAFAILYFSSGKLFSEWKRRMNL